VRGRPGKLVQLSESEIRQLSVESREIFLKQPNLLKPDAPIKICVLLLHLETDSVVPAPGGGIVA
ncbi:hypothetical protein CICLE_v10024270mg, partial [Citrus x clementina]